MARRILNLGFLFLFLAAATDSRAVTIDGFAAMGASETQGSTYNHSWVPYEVDYQGWNFGGAGNPYNVAVAGSTSTMLLAEGQDTQVAALVASGEVDVAMLSVGSDDFHAVATDIASGALSGSALTAFCQNVVSNIDTAMDTVLTANPLGMIVGGISDLELTPGGRNLFTTPTIQARGEIAISEMNSLLEPQVLSRGLVFLDQATLLRDLNAAPLVVGGVTIDMIDSGTEPTHFFQDSVHPAAVGNGVLANLYIEAVNLAYGTNYPLLTDEQILNAAGLGDLYTGETSNIDYAKYVVLPTPEPSSLMLSFLAAVVFLLSGPMRKRSVAAMTALPARPRPSLTDAGGKTGH